MTTNYEKYLAGEPLNDELAALKRGDPPDAARPPGIWGAWAEPLQIDDAERPLRTDERAALRELRQAPGWAVLQRLMERATIQHIKAATALSEDDPLGNGTELAALWHNVKVWKKLTRQVSVMVETELVEQRLEAAHGKRTENDTAQQGAQA